MTGRTGSRDGRGGRRSGLVTEVQRYSLDDGPGIRTTVFMKGCPLRCLWCQNPETQRRAPEVAFRRARCIGAGTCAAACSHGAIVAGPARVDRDRCQACSRCVDACPTGALATLGREVGVDELVAEVLRDRVFYGASGGGVTVSGGEPALQHAFVAAFLRRCREEGLTTAVETCGHASPRALDAVVAAADRVYFDLKLISPVEHARLTGVSNLRVLANARALVRRGAPVTFRVPLVPDLTLTEANLAGIGRFVRALGVREIEVCPYHDHWRGKLAWLGAPAPRVELRAPTASEIARAAGALAAMDITARLLG